MSNLFTDKSFLSLNLNLPDIADIQISGEFSSPERADPLLESEELYPEPRSLNSSEFSGSESVSSESSDSDEGDNLKDQSNKKKTNKEDLTGTQDLSKVFPLGVVKSKRVRFTEEQDKIILNLYRTYGGNWKKISTFMGEIGPNVVKNRFYKKLKKRSIQESQEQSEREKAEISKERAEKLAQMEKRVHLQSLYEKAKTIEAYIKRAKTQIEDLADKGKNDSSK